MSFEHTLKLVNKCFSHIQLLFKLLHLCYSSRELFVYCAVSLKVRTQLPLTLQILPELSLLIFKIPGFKYCCLNGLSKFGHSDFQCQMLWELSSPCRLPSVTVSLFLTMLTLTMPVVPSLPQGLASPLHLCPSYPRQCGLFYLVVCSVSLGCFLGIYTDMSAI